MKPLRLRLYGNPTDTAAQGSGVNINREIKINKVKLKTAKNEEISYMQYNTRINLIMYKLCYIHKKYPKDTSQYMYHIVCNTAAAEGAAQGLQSHAGGEKCCPLWTLAISIHILSQQ